MQRSQEMGKHLSFPHLFMHWCKILHNGISKTFLKILSMMPNRIGLKFAIRGKIIKILYKNRGKLENICSIYI